MEVMGWDCSGGVERSYSEVRGKAKGPERIVDGVEGREAATWRKEGREEGKGLHLHTSLSQESVMEGISDWPRQMALQSNDDACRDTMTFLLKFCVRGVAGRDGAKLRHIAPFPHRSVIISFAPSVLWRRSE